MSYHPPILLPFHRGAYDHLWAEFRYQVLAVSIRATPRLSRRLGAVPPKILGLLEQLAWFAFQPQTERLQALLQAYLHGKSLLDRLQRRTLVEGLTKDDPDALRTIYSLGVQQKIEPLAGCRLFFPPRGLYKFWNGQEAPGLWICLGPYLFHCRGQRLKNRLTSLFGENPDPWLSRLQAGVSRETYETLSSGQRAGLENLALIAHAGNHRFLHPHVSSALRAESADEPLTPIHAMLWGLEVWWDRNPELMPRLPLSEEWHDSFLAQTEVATQTFSFTEREEARETIQEAFRVQSESEHWQPAIPGLAEASESQDMEEEDSRNPDSDESPDEDDPEIIF